MKAKLKARLIEEPEFKTVGKNNSPLTTLKVAEDVWGKEGDNFVKKGENFFDVKLWNDKAVDAQMIEVGQVIDFGENLIVGSQHWEFKGKPMSKLELTAFDFEIVERQD